MSVGPVGREFTATHGRDEFPIGTVLPLKREPGKALEVIGTDGKTYHGSTWYRFRVIVLAGAISKGPA
jgi:hypothetical protein